MKFTPLDIRQKRFESSFRGYAARDVQGFLELLAVEFEEVVKQNIALKEELKRTQVELDRHQEGERQSEKIVYAAHQKLVQVVDDINELKRQRARFEAELRALVATHLKILEVAASPDSAAPLQVDDNVSFLAPKKAGTP